MTSVNTDQMALHGLTPRPQRRESSSHAAWEWD